MVRLAITGASGNVGTGLLRRLRAQWPDSPVAAISRRPPAQLAPYDHATWHSIDISMPTTVARLVEVFQTVDVVVHLAWAIQPVRDEPYLHRVNVEGTRAVLDAVLAANIQHVVYASSLGVYTTAPESGGFVDERWPSTGIPTSVYSRDKVETERMAEAFERENPQITLTRVRPPLVAQREAAGVLSRYFLGFLGSPKVLSRASWLPFIPLPSELSLQLVHANDVADAILRCIDQRSAGVFNIATGAVSGHDLAAAVETRSVAVPIPVVRSLVTVLWKLRVLALSPGWFDILTHTPALSSSHAQMTLDWTPQISAKQCLDEILVGLYDRAPSPSPALRR